MGFSSNRTANKLRINLLKLPIIGEAETQQALLRRTIWPRWISHAFYNRQINKANEINIILWKMLRALLEARVDMSRRLLETSVVIQEETAAFIQTGNWTFRSWEMRIPSASVIKFNKWLPGEEATKHIFTQTRTISNNKHGKIQIILIRQLMTPWVSILHNLMPLRDPWT